MTPRFMTALALIKYFVNVAHVLLRPSLIVKLIFVYETYNRCRFGLTFCGTFPVASLIVFDRLRNGSKTATFFNSSRLIRTLPSVLSTATC